MLLARVARHTTRQSSHPLPKESGVTWSPEPFISKLRIGRRASWAIAAAAAAVSAISGARAKGPNEPSGRAAANPFIWARNGTEFRQALQEGAAEGISARCLILHRHRAVVDDRPGAEKERGHDVGGHGNDAKLRWVGPPGQDMLVVQGVQGVANRGLYLEKFNFGVAGTMWGCNAARA